MGGALERLLSHVVSLWYGVGTPIPEVRFERATTLLDYQTQADTYTKTAQAIQALKGLGYRLDLDELAKRLELPLIKEQNDSLP